MKTFIYKGRNLTLKELLPFSAVPEKTLRNRLYSSASIWSVENAVETPFGKVGKTPEISKHTVDVSVNKSNKKSARATLVENKIDSTERGNTKDKFTCCGCGHFKSIKQLGSKISNNKHMYCTSCTDRANKMANRTKQEIKITQDHYKQTGKRYAEGKEPLFFVTNDDEYKEK